MKMVKNLRTIVLSLSLLGAASFTQSCASSQSSSNGNTYTKTAAGATVQVTEDEYHIHMPTTIPDGSITFHITNTGSKDHNFKIKGHGVEQQLPTELQPGQTTDMTVSLVPGDYSVICPLIGHPDLGMNLTLHVVAGL